MPDLRRPLRAAAAACLAIALAAPPASAQEPESDALVEYLRLMDQALSMQVAVRGGNEAEIDRQLDAAGRAFLGRGSPAADLATVRAELGLVSNELFGLLEREIVESTNWPRLVPQAVSRAIARRALAGVRSKFGEAIAQGGDPLPHLREAIGLLSRLRGITRLPPELDRLAQAGERARRLAATMPRPPTTVASAGGLGPPPATMPGAPGGGMRPPGAIGGPTMGPPPGGTGLPGSGPTGGPSGPGMGPATGPGMGPATGPGMGGPTGPGMGPATGPGVATGPGMGAPSGPGMGAPSGPGMGAPSGPGMTAPPMGGPAPATPVAAPPRPSRPPTVIHLAAGTLEAQAKVTGRFDADVVGVGPRPEGDGVRDTEIELKLAAPELTIDWIELVTEVEGEVVLWTTRGEPLVGVAHRERLLNHETGAVRGIVLEDYATLTLYVQDDGILEWLPEPGTVTIGFASGEVATIPIWPSDLRPEGAPFRDPDATRPAPPSTIDDAPGRSVPRLAPAPTDRLGAPSGGPGAP